MSARSDDRVGTLRQDRHQRSFRQALPTRSFRDHPPPEGEGDLLEQ